MFLNIADFIIKFTPINKRHKISYSQNYLMSNKWQIEISLLVNEFNTQEECFSEKTSSTL
jgi:hypothetical protein